MVTDPLSIAAGAVGVAAFEAVREFFKRIGGKLGDDVGEVVRAYTTFRLKNLTRQLERASEMLGAAGYEPCAVPPRMLTRWIEHASVEDDETLSERWAALLANAAIATDDESVPPIFATILSELTPFAARILDSLRD